MREPPANLHKAMMNDSIVCGHMNAWMHTPTVSLESALSALVVCMFERDQMRVEEIKRLRATETQIYVLQTGERLVPTAVTADLKADADGVQSRESA